MWEETFLSATQITQIALPIPFDGLLLDVVLRRHVVLVPRVTCEPHDQFDLVEHETDAERDRNDQQDVVKRHTQPHPGDELHEQAEQVDRRLDGVDFDLADRGATMNLATRMAVTIMQSLVRSRITLRK